MLASLTEQYTACCQAYADLFLKLFGKSWSDGEAYWSLGRIGTNLCIDRGISFPMSDITYVVDNDMTAEDVRAWTIYNERAHKAGVFLIDIEAWHNGGERISDADMQLLMELQEDAHNARMDEGTESPRYTNATNRYDIARDRILHAINIYRSDIV